MPQIQSLEQMKDYIQIELGAPIVTVEIDRVKQMPQFIDDSIQLFQRYNSDEGSYLSYAIFQTSAGVNEYDLSGYEAGFDMEISLGVDGINTLFAPSHELLYSDFIKKGSVFGTMSPDYSPGMVMTSYDTAMLYLKEIKNTFGKMFTVQYNSNKGKLIITPTPMEAATGVIYMYKREDAINLYNHPLVKQIIMAKAKMQWGTNLLRKYSNVNMPDGLNVNGQQIYDEGKAEFTEIMDNLKLENPGPDFFVQ
jgi:hypothetical protein